MIYHAVAYESSFSKATSSSYDHLFEFPKWSLTRASTVFCYSAQRLPARQPQKGVRYINKVSNKVKWILKVGKLKKSEEIHCGLGSFILVKNYG